MRSLAALLGMAFLAAPALADTTLIDDGRWQVIGVDAAGGPTISVTQKNGSALGNFGALRISSLTGSNPGLLLSLSATGVIEPTLPPASLPGATAVLARYADCNVGLTGPLQFTALELPKKTKKQYLELHGTASNGDSLETKKLKIFVFKPSNKTESIEFSYKLKALRDLCVDSTQQAATDEFRAVEFDTQYLSATQQLSDLTRYIKDVQLDCGLLTCKVDKVSFCAPLENVTGPVIDTPKQLQAPDLDLVHTTSTPAATPTLSVELAAPYFGQFKPQGAVTESNDPLARNVEFWADWVKVKHNYKAGNLLANFVFAIEAQAPETRGCDRMQN